MVLIQEYNSTKVVFAAVAAAAAAAAAASTEPYLFQISWLSDLGGVVVTISAWVLSRKYELQGWLRIFLGFVYQSLISVVEVWR